MFLHKKQTRCVISLRIVIKLQTAPYQGMKSNEKEALILLIGFKESTSLSYSQVKYEQAVFWGFFHRIFILSTVKYAWEYATDSVVASASPNSSGKEGKTLSYTTKFFHRFFPNILRHLLRIFPKNKNTWSDIRGVLVVFYYYLQSRYIFLYVRDTTT